MIRSMTGYGSADIERDGQRLTAEVRSVNHRFCEVSIRAPKVVGLFEDQIRQLIVERFSRGKFNLTITWSGAGEGSGRAAQADPQAPGHRRRARATPPAGGEGAADDPPQGPARRRRDG